MHEPFVYVYMRVSTPLISTPAQPQHIYMEGLQGVRVLTTVIERSMKNTQVLYAACMCVWVMSFNERLLGRLRSRALLRVLVQIVNKVDRLKVVRIIYGAFANMQVRGACVCVYACFCVLICTSVFLHT
jgi:hypothetical protein